MNLSESGVRRPVATLMAFVAVFILGCIAWSRLAIDMLPEIESPSISVFTRWDGASTEDVEQQITRVVESALGSVTDLDEITSQTSEGVSRVTCKFKWGTELGEAANDMRDLLERAKRRLWLRTRRCASGSGRNSASEQRATNFGYRNGIITARSSPQTSKLHSQVEFNDIYGSVSKWS